MTRQPSSSTPPTAARSRWSGRLVAFVAATLLTALVTAVPAHAVDQLVRGTVTFVDGAPAAGVSVTFHRKSDGAVVHGATTDFEGKYAVRVGEGTYRVGFELDQNSPTRVTGRGAWPSGLTIDEGQDLVVTSARDGIDGILLRDGAIEGDMGELDGGYVSVFRLAEDGSAPLVADEKTSGRRYSIVVPVGRYVVRFQALDRAAEFSGGVATFEDADVLTVGDSETVELNTTMKPGGSLQGQLFAPDGFRDAELTLAAFQKVPGGWEKMRYATFVQESEWFRIIGLNTAAYRICWTSKDDTLDDDLFPDQCIGGVDVAAARDLQAVAGEARYLPKTTLRTAMVVAGRVTDPDGNPVEGVRVCRTIDADRCDPITHPSTRADTTDADGRYSFRIPADAGPFTLQLTPPPAKGLVTTFNGGAASAESAALIPVVLNQTVTQDVELIADDDAALSVGGTIRSSQGTALPDGSVAIRRLGDDPEGLGVAAADRKGRYELLLAPGTYRLSYTANGYKTIARTLDVRADVTQDAAISRSATPIFKGQLLRDGQPLAGATVFAYFPQRPDLILVTTTAANGGYFLRGVPSNGYSFYYDDELTGRRHYLDDAVGGKPGVIQPVAPYDVPAFVRVEARPTITTEPRVGRAVSVGPARWNTEVTLSYTWYAGSTKVASTLAYTPKAADVGKPLRLMVTAKRGTTEVTTNTLARVVQG